MRRREARMRTRNKAVAKETRFWERTAEVRPQLLIAVGVIAVVAIVFWGWRGCGDEPLPPADPNAPPAKAFVVCGSCQHVETMSMEAYRELPRDEIDNLQCTKCKKWEAYFVREGGDLIVPGGGG